MLAPTFGIADSYGGFTPQYYNAMGLFILRMILLFLCFIYVVTNILNSVGSAQHLLSDRFSNLVWFYTRSIAMNL